MCITTTTCNSTTSHDKSFPIYRSLGRKCVFFGPTTIVGEPPKYSGQWRYPATRRRTAPKTIVLTFDFIIIIEAFRLVRRSVNSTSFIFSQYFFYFILGFYVAEYEILLSPFCLCVLIIIFVTAVTNIDINQFKVSILKSYRSRSIGSKIQW